jgi:hypothetical protein
MRRNSIIIFLFSTLLCCSELFADPQINANIVNVTGGQPLALQIVTIIQNVQAAGYPLIKNIELQKGVYKVKAINSQGLDINLVIDPQKGTIIKPGKSVIRFSLIDAITQVAAKGYHGIYKVEADEGSYDVYAIDDKGNRVTLEVDAMTGEVSKHWF